MYSTLTHPPTVVIVVFLIYALQRRGRMMDGREIEIEDEIQAFT